ncbi:Ndufb8, NADH dehydrogenase 19kDa subunit [Sparassis latifolia]|uniref:NADH dehydrogenase [ubiquinone] 1 beta subcomplex subunit 8, mitochondrial n=1 Tax=Sparassis crispa TaxID=139825 RepID=A0A401H0M6_9APHY|nr:predicted protein [Sparassis crispa]GBE87986.1 predicted protein [Sparassis crispa]
MQTTIVNARAAALRGATRPLCLSPRLRTYATPVAVKRDEDPQLAGYPQLPYISRQLLPPKGWEDPQMRRNFGDTLHEEEEVLSMWGPDVSPLPPKTALRQFTIATLGFVTFGVVVNYLVPARPAVPREYPYSGLVKELGGLEENKANPEDESDED